MISSAAVVEDADTPVLGRGSLTVDFTGTPVVGDRLGILNAPTSITQISTRGNRVFYIGVPIGTFTGGDHQKLTRRQLQFQQPPWMPFEIWFAA